MRITIDHTVGTTGADENRKGQECPLLSLLSLGIRDITLGPKLPAFVSPTVPDVLVKNFDLKPNTTVEADMARMVPAK
jgi:hydroxylamine reductase (hybrid-cluster protein)